MSRDALIQLLLRQDIEVDQLRSENKMLRTKQKRLLIAVVKAESAAVQADARYVSKSYEQHAQ